MKKLFAVIAAATILLSATSCAANPVRGEDVSSPPSSGAQSSSETVSSEVSSEPVSSEYPSSQEPISSEASSEVSSISSKVSSKALDSKAASSKKPASSKPASSKPASSKPVSSAPPPSSTPPSSTPPKNEPATNSSQMKAVWISFLEFQSFKGSSEQGFRNTISTYFDKSVGKGLNTVIVQVRPHGDSFYESDYYPWSKSVSGTMGQALSYDPVAIMVEEAHARKLSIHAWINPYRTMTDAEMALIDSSYPVKAWYESGNRSNYMVKVASDGRWWLKPGNAEVVQLIQNGVAEIVSKYNVDGVHIDDYFYGDKLTVYGDSKAQAQANTTALVKGIYSTVKAIKPSVLFGVSPMGGFREGNDLPASDLSYHSTDLKKWCQNPGYMDYLMPQVYWGYAHETQPFTMTLNKWQDFVTEPSVALYIGIAPSGLPASEIEEQVRDINASYRATGYCLYRYEYMHNLNLQ